MRRITPDMPREVAQRILNEESADLKARWMLIDFAEAAFNERRFEAVASLVHAYEYLKDRKYYQLHPWPKGMVKFVMPKCRHQRRDTPKEPR